MTILDLMKYLGREVNWEAIGALGSTGAVVWALWLARRQAHDDRERRAAILKAVVVPVIVGRDELIHFLNSIGPRQVVVSQLMAGLAPKGGLLGGERAAASAEVVQWNRTCRIYSDQLTAALTSLARRLDEIDLMSLPSTIAIESVIETQRALKTFRGATQGNTAMQMTAALVQAEQMRVALDTEIARLITVAVHFGATASEADHVGLFHQLRSRRWRHRIPDQVRTAFDRHTMRALDKISAAVTARARKREQAGPTD